MKDNGRIILKSGKKVSNQQLILSTTKVLVHTLRVGDLNKISIYDKQTKHMVVLSETFIRILLLNLNKIYKIWSLWNKNEKISKSSQTEKVELAKRGVIISTQTV